MTKEEISKTLQDLRVANGYTQKQLANVLGMKNYSTISSWEIGKSEPSLSTFAKLCSLYGITDIEEVFPGLTVEMQSAATNTDTALIEDDVSFAERLKRILSERKIKLSQLCRDTGISYNTMQSIIKRDTDIKTISTQIPIEIAKYLEIDFYELVGEEAAKKIQKEKPATDNGNRLSSEKQEFYDKVMKLDNRQFQIVNDIVDSVLRERDE